ncbi:MAG: alkaline phosphatase family protein [Prevotella sp.]|nr:alkaline phosphatase family protein [Prevotella sp.]MDY5491012.1 alkaline phosphatase family protein [Prevotella sp.]
MRQYISTILLAALASGNIQAQSLQPAPRLVVNIAIDQLRTDYIEHFSPLYTSDGFKKLLERGCVYEAASYPFSPVDRASAVASIATGTTPHYNNIVSSQWLDRSTLRPVFCTDDATYTESPAKMATSTTSDELKVATRGRALVYSVAIDKDAAVMAGGHAADGAFWINEKDGRWSTSSYYPNTSQSLLKTFNSASYKSGNDGVAQLAEACTEGMGLGKDNITDMLSLTLEAKIKDFNNWQTDMEIAYLKLDKTLARIISYFENKIGKDNVLFVITSTGYTNDEPVDYKKYNIPTGTFYITRTANLLNMYLSAIYGQARYVETCYHNQIYLDRKLIEQKRLSFNDVITRSKELLVQTAGVRSVNDSPYNPSVSGDLVLEIAPGWKVLNEDNNEQFTSRADFVPFPIIFYGANTKAERISTPATVDRIAPTIAKAIRIRAPNACSSAPLQ